MFMLSTALEVSGLAVLTAGTTAGAYVLAGLGVAILTLGIVGGAVLMLLGYLVGAPEQKDVILRVRRPREAVPASNGRG